MSAILHFNAMYLLQLNGCLENEYKFSKFASINTQILQYSVVYSFLRELHIKRFCFEYMQVKTGLSFMQTKFWNFEIYVSFEVVIGFKFSKWKSL